MKTKLKILDQPKTLKYCSAKSYNCFASLSPLRILQHVSHDWKNTFLDNHWFIFINRHKSHTLCGPWKIFTEKLPSKASFADSPQISKSCQLSLSS